MSELKEVQANVRAQLANSKWFGYPLEGSRAWDLVHAVIGLGGEVGEVQELLKETVFRGKAHSNEEFISELGDVLWYLTAAAELCGTTLDEIWKYNEHKLQDRRKNGKNGKVWEG